MGRWVMGQELNGSLGSGVILSDTFPALSRTVHVTELLSVVHSTLVNFNECSSGSGEFRFFGRPRTVVVKAVSPFDICRVITG